MLICTCDQAEEDTCKECPKGKLIKPDLKIHNPHWRRYDDIPEPEQED